MGFSLNSVSSVVGSLTGRANTTVPTAETPQPGLLQTVGNILGTAIGIPAVGTTVGTIGDALLNTGTRSSNVGRATANATSVTLESPTSAQRIPSLIPGLSKYGVQLRNEYTGKRVKPSQARRLVQLLGLSGAAEALGATVEAVAIAATRPTRRRGISAAAMRTTRRTLCALERFSHYINKRSCRRKC